ncbi:MAG TPA: cobalt ECF transporter T component CbiQ [Aggregatilineaceae bacterium]|nr:cobalt ECF transporter T component CbiQ [Aggregatilineaceae bacterium]
MKAAFRERYQAGDSLLHQLDPRVKVVMILVLITGIVLTPERAWPAYPLLWALIGALAAVGRLGVRRVARMGGLALPFTLAAATLLFTLPGRPVVTVLGLTISDAGLARFLSIVLKSWLAVQSALILSMTTSFTDLLWAFSSLRVPRVLVAIISFMYRYLFTLQDEAQRLMRARAARSGTVTGRKSGGGLVWRARVAGHMVGSLFLRSYERSERVYAAMLARGYTGQMRMISPPPLTIGAIGQGAIPILALALIEALAVLWWRR